MAKKQFGEWLTQKFIEWRSEDWRRTASGFARMIGCPPQNMGRWLDGKSLPEIKYIEKLARLGPEIYDFVKLPRPSGDGDLGIDQHILYLFTRGWKRFPPDLQRELEELVSTATEEEAEEIFRDAIQTWRERRNLTDAASDDAPDEGSPAPAKGAKKRPIQLRRRVAGA